MKVVALILVILLALWAIFPAFLTVQTAFSSSYVFGIPKKVSLNNWRWMPWDKVLRWSKNSAIVAIPSVLLSIVVSCMAGFGFARYEFPGSKILFALVVVTMVIPGLALFVPRFVIMAKLGLYNSYVGMILPVILNPAGIFFAKQYYHSLDEDILNAARMDGASEWQVFWGIILPMSGSLIVIVAIFAFGLVWGDLLWQMIMARDPALQTLIVGLATVLQGTGMNLIEPKGGATMQGIEAVLSTLIALPPMVLVVVFSKYFVGGLKIEMGGIK